MTLETIAVVPPIKLLGLLGAGFYILNYVLLTMRVLSSEHWGFFVINLTASSLVLISLSLEFNAATAVIQTFWIGVSIWGLVTRLRPNRLPRATSDRLRPLG